MCSARRDIALCHRKIFDLSISEHTGDLAKIVESSIELNVKLLELLELNKWKAEEAPGYGCLACSDSTLLEIREIVERLTREFYGL